jgi:hypothetical protein
MQRLIASHAALVSQNKALTQQLAAQSVEISTLQSTAAAQTNGKAETATYLDGVTAAIEAELAAAPAPTAPAAPASA